MSDPIHIAVTGFASDPHAWFAWLRDELIAGRGEVVLATVMPCAWQNDAGHSWRIVRTSNGIEIRPELQNPFLYYGESPKITALEIAPDSIAIELTVRTGRWVDRFPLDAFDVAELGRAMIEERSLPHDNLPQLFPVR